MYADDPMLYTNGKNAIESNLNVMGKWKMWLNGKMASVLL
jgi:hypothetical protein